MKTPFAAEGGCGAGDAVVSGLAPAAIAAGREGKAARTFGTGTPAAARQLRHCVQRE